MTHKTHAHTHMIVTRKCLFLKGKEKLLAEEKELLNKAQTTSVRGNLTTVVTFKKGPLKVTLMWLHSVQLYSEIKYEEAAERQVLTGFPASLPSISNSFCTFLQH